MPRPVTRTYTWTQTRLETIQDQFRYFMTYGGIRSVYIDSVIYGVGEKAVEAVGIYGTDATALRVIEAQLKVDWERSATLSVTVPTLSGGMSGWDERQTPEVKQVGRRFADAADRLQATVSFWVQFVRGIRDDEQLYQAWCDRLGLSETAPEWRDPPQRIDENVFDVPELDVSILRAGPAPEDPASGFQWALSYGMLNPKLFAARRMADEGTSMSLLRVPLENIDGAYIVAEVDDFDLASTELVAGRHRRGVDTAAETFSDALGKVEPAIELVLSKLRNVAPDEITVDFGLKIGGEAGIIWAKGTAEAHLTVSVTWKPKGEPASHAVVSETTSTGGTEDAPGAV